MFKEFGLKRNDRFTIKLNRIDRELIDQLALRLDRSRSSAIRFAISEVARAYDVSGRRPLNDNSHKESGGGKES